MLQKIKCTWISWIFDTGQLIHRQGQEKYKHWKRFCCSRKQKI